MPGRMVSLISAASLLGACAHEESILPPAGEGLARGTWGGDNAGVLVADTAHLHVGCTFGNFARPTVLDDAGRFSVAGSYVLRAYPVQVGAVGPVTVTFAREPDMQQCPICRKPMRAIAP